MFNGFTDETFEFFMALSFNNNREFFHENHDWYMRAVRQPLLDLAGDLAETIERIDDDLERRPERCVSRINRDIRFSRDKSPYRSFMWIAFHKGEDKHAHPGFYMDISCDGIGFGMGFYEENKPLMEAHRQLLLTHPEKFRSVIENLDSKISVSVQTYKRMKVPETLDESLAKWYSIRCVTLSCGMNTSSPAVQSHELGEIIKDAYLKMKPMYDYLDSLQPVLV